MGIFIYQYLRSYASVAAPIPTPSPTQPPSPTPPPAPATGPVSKLWYFAEGRVGAGFKEFLTMGNPTHSNCQVNIQYLTQPDRGNSGTKIVSINVPATRRVTEWVDGDLSRRQQDPGFQLLRLLLWILQERRIVAALWLSVPCTLMPWALKVEVILLV